MVLVQDALDQIVADVNIAQTSQSLEDWEKRNSAENIKSVSRLQHLKEFLHQQAFNQRSTMKPVLP